MSRLLRRASSLVSLLPSCSCPIVSAASPLPLWLLITMIPVASHCCIALRLKSSVLVQCLAPLVPLLALMPLFCFAASRRFGGLCVLSCRCGCYSFVRLAMRAFCFSSQFCTNPQVGGPLSDTTPTAVGGPISVRSLCTEVEVVGGKPHGAMSKKKCRSRSER